MSVSAERAIMGRSAILTGWMVGGAGFVMMAVSVVGWVTILPLKTVEPRYIAVHDDGKINDITTSVQDAPHVLFGQAVEWEALRTYVTAREAYVPETDRNNDHLAKVLSVPDVQAKINADRKRPESPLLALGKDGHVDVSNFRFHPQTVDKATDVRTYIVQFDRTVWHGTKADATQAWTATVVFKFEPWLQMTNDDRSLNPGGFQAISYSATSNTPDTARH
jgi:type IV secretory pathway component VirB8